MRRAVIRVGKPTVVDRRVTVDVAADGSRWLSRLIRDEYWSEYEFDPREVPASVLSVPVVATLLPLAWVVDVDIEIDTLDASYAFAVPAMREGWLDTFRGFDASGRFRVSSVSDQRPTFSDEAAVSLFSGGVDSTATAIAHGGEDLTLCSVWGIDVAPSSAIAWSRSRALLDRFARERGIGVSIVRSNLRRFLDERLLDVRYGARLTQWWRASVGLVLPAVAAPVAWNLGAPVIYMPATHDGEYDAPYGSRPGIDEKIHVAGIRVEHDGHDLSRHEKLVAVVGAGPDQPLLVCRSGTARGTGNCSQCEKCLRTMVAMISLGVDPTRHGLALDEHSAARLERLVDTGILGSADTPYFWRRVVAGAREATEPVDSDARRLLGVARDLDVDALWEQGRRPLRLRARALIGRSIPHWLRPRARRVYLRLFRHW